MIELIVALLVIVIAWWSGSNLVQQRRADVAVGRKLHPIAYPILAWLVIVASACVMGFAAITGTLRYGALFKMAVLMALMLPLYHYGVAVIKDLFDDENLGLKEVAVFSLKITWLVSVFIILFFGFDHVWVTFIY